MNEIPNVIETGDKTFKITLQDSVGGKYTRVECPFDVTAFELIDAITSRWKLPKETRGVLMFKDGDGKSMQITGKDKVYSLVKGHKKGTLIIDFERTAG